MVRLQLLGALGLTGGDGHEIRPVLAQPKRFALLAYLALAEPRGFRRRDTLLPLFWPDTAGEPARASLRRSLHFLRSHLGEGVIVTRGEEEVDVAADHLTCDARVFEEHLAANREAEALALYHGDLLAGFFVSDAAPELDEWIDRTRRRYRDAAFTAAERLSDREATAGRRSTARFWSERALDLQPLSEPALLRMLRLLDLEGDRVEALRRYDDFARRLKAELGVEPGPELRGIQQTLRERRPTPAALEPSPQPLPHAIPLPAPPRRWWPAGVAIAAAIVTTWAVALRRPATIPVLAVGALTTEGGSDTTGVGSTLPELIATGLGNLRDVQVISRARLYEVSGEMRGQGLTPAALLSAAKRAGADRAIEGEVYPQAGGLRLDLRLVDLTTGAVRRSWVLRAGDAFALADSATARLAVELRRPAPAEGIADLSPTSLVGRRYFDDGLRAYYRREFTTADALFGLALGEDPNFALALYYAARTRNFLGITRDQLLPIVRRARDAGLQGTRYERLLTGAYWASANQSPLALPLADSLLDAYPYEPEAYTIAAAEHWYAADFAGELAIYRRLEALDSASLESGGPWCRACLAVQGIADAYTAMDSLERSLEAVRRLRRLHPDDKQAWASEVSTLAAMGRSAEAATVFEGQRDSVGATVLEVASMRVWLGLWAGDFAGVDRAIAPLLGLTGESHHAGLWMQVIDDRYQGRLGRAAVAARMYEATGPNGSLPRAMVLFESGQARAAAALFDSVRLRWDVSDTTAGNEARQHAWTLTHEITALAAAGDTALVARLADTLERVGRWSSYARDQRMHHYARALLWDARGRRAEAIAEYRQALTSPTYGYTRINYRLAADLVALGRPREAIPLLRAAIHGGFEGPNLYVTHTELRELLAQAFDVAGQRDSATAHYRWVAAAWRDADPPFRERWLAAVSRTRRAP